MRASKIMKNETRLIARKFLKDLGFFFELKPAQIDRKFLKMLPPDQKALVELIWTKSQLGIDVSKELYSTPKTLAQASALFSHDAFRYVDTMSWITDVVDEKSPSSLVEMGCGAGFLLKFLNERRGDMHVNGVDAAENLIRIGSKLIEQDLITGDYLTLMPDSEYDLIICDFGYDNSDIPVSRKPHSSISCGPATYCPGCAEDMQFHFAKYMKAWRKWARPNGSLALTGRMTDYTNVRAITFAAKDQGWFVDLSQSKILACTNRYIGKEFFPAWYFTTDESQSATDEEIATFYTQNIKG